MNFSLKWFKSEKKKLQESEVSPKEEKSTLLCEQEREQKSVALGNYVKPFKGLKLVNDTLTLLLNDNIIITLSGVTFDKFNLIRESKDEEELYRNLRKDNPVTGSDDDNGLFDKIISLDDMDLLIDSGDFEKRDQSIYLKGVNRTIPKLLVIQFIKALKENEVSYEALKKFWIKCCLNPNARSAEDLYDFLSNHQFKIDKHGNFYAYRKVVKKDVPDPEYVDFIANSYTKIKAVWKKKPEDYRVEEIQDEVGNFSFIIKRVNTFPEGAIRGNLDTLYMELPLLNQAVYTSAHTGKESYRIGEVISMPRYMGNDDNNVSCSAGFHGASKQYDYSGFGDTNILMIINPVDVLAVPKGEIGKLRTCRWFFATTLPNDEKYILDDDDFDVTELGDIFEEKCMMDLEEHVKRGYAEEVTRHTYTLPNMSSFDISSMVNSLEKMSLVISERVKSI